jgi:hypothetical protein
VPRQVGGGMRVWGVGGGGVVRRHHVWYGMYGGWDGVHRPLTRLAHGVARSWSAHMTGTQVGDATTDMPCTFSPDFFVVVVYSVDTSVNMRDHTHCRYSLRNSCCSHQHIAMLHTSSTSTHILVSEAHTATQDTLVRSHHSRLGSELCAKPSRALYACGCNTDQ